LSQSGEEKDNSFSEFDSFVFKQKVNKKRAEQGWAMTHARIFLYSEFPADFQDEFIHLSFHSFD